MRRSRCFSAVVVWLAIASVFAPHLARTASPNTQNPVVTDVALRDGGLLLGQVIQPEGVPLANTPVTLHSGGKELATGVTNPAGFFAFSGLVTGTYQVVASTGMGTCQAWTADAAPPAAHSGILIVAGPGPVRGQHEPRAFAGRLVRPLLLGSLVAAAIAVPIAVSNANRTSASSE